MSQYIYNLLLAIDQAANAVLLGDPDESISGRLGRAMASGSPKSFVPPMAKAVDYFAYKTFGVVHHTANSIEPEERPFEKELWSWIKL